MKAVVFSSVGSGGVVQFARIFSKALRELGCEVTDGCTCGGKGKAKEFAFKCCYLGVAR